MHVVDLDTLALVVDLDVLERNIDDILITYNIVGRSKVSCRREALRHPQPWGVGHEPASRAGGREGGAC